MGDKFYCNLIKFVNKKRTVLFRKAKKIIDKWDFHDGCGRCGDIAKSWLPIFLKAGYTTSLEDDFELIHTYICIYNNSDAYVVDLPYYTYEQYSDFAHDTGFYKRIAADFHPNSIIVLPQYKFPRTLDRYYRLLP